MRGILDDLFIVTTKSQIKQEKKKNFSDFNVMRCVGKGGER